MGKKKTRITPPFFHLLLSLSEGPKHGYILMNEIEERTQGRILLGPSSLYYSLGRLEDLKLIRETDKTNEEEKAEDAPAQPHEDRRRYYELTEEGRERLKTEMRDLADLVAHAELRGLLG